MTDVGTEKKPVVDYLAPFETFQAYGIRGGMIYRGRVRPEFAADRAELDQILRHAPGEHRVEELGGRLYATLRVYWGRRPKRRLWLHVLLLVLTVITTLGAGAEMARRQPRGLALIPFEFVLEAATDVAAGEWRQVVDSRLGQFLSDMSKGVPYAAALLFILLAHEMGHYFAARRYGIDATLPFLLPAPFAFGTFGAVIRMRSPITHRRALFDVGVAGPISGLVASVAACVIGLRMSHVVTGPPSAGVSLVLGESRFFAGLVRLVMGPAAAGDVGLHPVAVAGWLGLFITFLNLMPIGQLDGGHLWYALIGRKQRYVGMASLAVILGMGVMFPGWLGLAVLVVLLMRVGHPPVMDESVRLGWRRVAVGVALIVVFVLLFMPVPIDVIEYGGR